MPCTIQKYEKYKDDKLYQSLMEVIVRASREQFVEGE